MLFCIKSLDYNIITHHYTKHIITLSLFLVFLKR